MNADLTKEFTYVEVSGEYNEPLGKLCAATANRFLPCSTLRLVLPSTAARTEGCETLLVRRAGWLSMDGAPWTQRSKHWSCALIGMVLWAT